jgi:hypothetical protein
VITNACATQAILGVLLNNDQLSLGEELSSFKEFTRDFDAEVPFLLFPLSSPLFLSHCLPN